MTIENGYNGWANYETWRVNMEMFDGWDDIAGEITAETLEELANDILEVGVDNGSTALAFARAFISDVNWHEIAEHKNQAGKDALAD